METNNSHLGEQRNKAGVLGEKIKKEVYISDGGCSKLPETSPSPSYRVYFNDCLFSFTYQIALILHFWYKIGGKIFICVGHLMNSDLK